MFFDFATPNTPNDVLLDMTSFQIPKVRGVQMACKMAMWIFGASSSSQGRNNGPIIKRLL